MTSIAHRLSSLASLAALASVAGLTALSLTNIACGGDELGETVCDDGLDNDGDGATDCLDDDCSILPVCQGCGNHIRDGAEECDGEDLGGEFCESFGYEGGWLACNDDCTYNYSLCTLPTCGNDIAQMGEDCDGYDMGDHASCEELGFLGGFVQCDADTCTYDTSGCFDEVVCEGVSLTGRTEPDPPTCTGQPGNAGYVWTYYEWLDLGDTNDYLMRLELWEGILPNPFGPGTYDLTAADNYKGCAVCALLIRCADPNCQYPGKTYLPQAGTLDLQEIAMANQGSLRGALLHDLEWKEVEINWDTYDSTPIPAGGCFSLDASHVVDASVVQPQQ